MNISQPEPGTPEQHDPNEVTLLQEDWDTSTGVVIHRQLFSDGSRRVVTDGVEEVAPILSDREKAKQAQVNTEVSPEDAVDNSVEDDDVSDEAPTADDLTPGQPVAAPEEPVEEDDGLEALTVPKLKDHAKDNDIDLGDNTRKDDIIAAIRDSSSTNDEGQTSVEAEAAAGAEHPENDSEAAVINEIHTRFGDDVNPLQPEQVGHAPLTSPSAESDGPEAAEHNEARDNLEAQADEADKPALGSTDGEAGSQGDVAK